MVNGKISKWQEDGVFYAVWSAFTAWTQTGEERFRAPDVLALLDESIDWLERYCYEDEHGLFGRFHSCETPLPGSRGDGWDNAVGKPAGYTNVTYEGERIVQSFDIYVNLYMHATYCMMAAMNPPRAQDYLARAETLAESMEDFYGEGLPSYGHLLTEGGEILAAEPYGTDRCDFEWALSVPPLHPQPWRLPDIRRRLYEDAMAEPRGYFLAAWFSIMYSLDTDWFPEQKVLEAVEYAAAQCYPPGRSLPMPNTIIEMLEMTEENQGHYIRPQAFSIGPWLATITGLGLRRLPFGLAVRASGVLKSISDYLYRGGSINVSFEGEGDIESVEVNGEPLAHTLQVPEVMLESGENAIAVRMAQDGGMAGPRLVDSTVRLEQVSTRDGRAVYTVTAYGTNWLIFRGLDGEVQVLRDGSVVETESRAEEGRTYIGFDGIGEFEVVVPV
jgi:hypothetical protein